MMQALKDAGEDINKTIDEAFSGPPDELQGDPTDPLKVRPFPWAEGFGRYDEIPSDTENRIFWIIHLPLGT